MVCLYGSFGSKLYQTGDLWPADQFSKLVLLVDVPGSFLSQQAQLLFADYVS